MALSPGRQFGNYTVTGFWETRPLAQLTGYFARGSFLPALFFGPEITALHTNVFAETESSKHTTQQPRPFIVIETLLKPPERINTEEAALSSRPLSIVFSFKRHPNLDTGAPHRVRSDRNRSID